MAVWSQSQGSSGRACLLSLCVALLSGLLLGGAEAPAQPASTQRMAGLLRETIARGNPMNNRFQSAAQIPILQRRLGDNPAAPDAPALRYQLAMALLNSGRNLEALDELNRLEAGSTHRRDDADKANLLNLRLNQALCHLREAERLNCLSNHNADSCLLPLRGGGIHRWKDPARKALDHLAKTLDEFKDNLAARWLYNVAAMAVGDYPQQVPSRWLIPTNAFASEIPFPRFYDVAPAAGAAPNELSGGSLVEDLDGDGQLDIVVTSIGLQDAMHYYHNNGDGTFSDRTRQAGLEGLTGGLNLIQSDYNNDGFMDILVLRGAWMRDEGRYPNSLLRNRGDGTFEDVTEAAGLLSFHPTQTAVWFDFDGDGWLDLFIGNEHLATGRRNLCELYRNQRDGTFKEIARLSGVTIAQYVKGVVAGDFNNDGKPDLYVSVLGSPNHLFRNDGPKDPAQGPNAGWAFTDVAASAGVTEPLQSFPCWFFDYNNDGWEDLFVAGYKINDVGDIAADYLGLPGHGTRAKLYRNKGDGTFADATEQAGLNHVLHAMGCNWGDLDNDGWPDFYLGTGDPDLLTIIPNRMFRNDRGLRFQDITTAGGFGHLQKGHGVSFADIDNDGDQDVHADMGGAVPGDVYPNVLFENPGFTNHWIKLKLEGVRANRCAIGARVRVDFEDKGQERSVHRTVGSGSSFGSNPLRLEIGVGAATTIRQVEILWPGSGLRQRIGPLAADRLYGVKEGDNSPRDLPLLRFRFPSQTHSPHAGH